MMYGSGHTQGFRKNPDGMQFYKSGRRQLFNVILNECHIALANDWKERFER